MPEYILPGNFPGSESEVAVGTASTSTERTMIRLRSIPILPVLALTLAVEPLSAQARSAPRDYRAVADSLIRAATDKGVVAVLSPFLTVEEAFLLGTYFKSLSPDVQLTGWLFLTTRNIARHANRT